MRDSFKEWCETTDFSISEIDHRAVLEWESGKVPTQVYMSTDLYAELNKSMYSKHSSSTRIGTSPSIMSINSSVGSLHIQHVTRLRNFLLVGRKEDFDAIVAAGIDPVFWNDQERTRIDQEFEDIVIGDKK